MVLSQKLKSKRRIFNSKLKNFKTLEFDLDVYNKKARNNQKYMDSRELIRISPSMLSSECPKTIQYNLLNCKRKPMSMSRVIRICDNGNSIHEQYGEYFKQMNALWGGWECLECKNIWIDRVGLCPKCNSSPEKHKYKEVTIYKDEWQFKGRPDGVLLFSDGSKCVVDYKSIKTEDFKLLEDEYSIYKYYVQLNIYCTLLNIPFGMLLYIDRDGHNIKSFVFSTDFQIYKNIENIMKAIRLANKKKRLLPRPQDATMKSCELCKWCDFGNLCWGVLRGQNKCNPATFDECDRRNNSMKKNNL